MARNLLCVVFGHKWNRERLPNRTVRRTCRGCGDIDTVEKVFDVMPWLLPSGGGG